MSNHTSNLVVEHIQEPKSRGWPAAYVRREIENAISPEGTHFEQKSRALRRDILRKVFSG